MSFISKISKIVNAIGVTTASTPSTATTTSRSIAKDRLSVILASQRGSELLAGVDMNQLQKDVLEVVQRHIEVIDKNRPVNFQVRKDEEEVNWIEMQIELKDDSMKRKRYAVLSSTNSG